MTPLSRFYRRASRRVEGCTDGLRGVLGLGTFYLVGTRHLLSCSVSAKPLEAESMPSQNDARQPTTPRQIGGWIVFGKLPGKIQPSTCRGVVAELSWTI